MECCRGDVGSVVLAVVGMVVESSKGGMTSSEGVEYFAWRGRGERWGVCSAAERVGTRLSLDEKYCRVSRAG